MVLRLPANCFAKIPANILIRIGQGLLCCSILLTIVPSQHWAIHFGQTYLEHTRLINMCAVPWYCFSGTPPLITGVVS